MYQRLFVLPFLLILFTLAGCGSPDPTPVALATIAPTETAEATETAVPPTNTATLAPTETETAVPTKTSTATATATKTPTPTKTPTNTPEPTDTPKPTNTAAPMPTNTAAPPPPAALPASGAPPAGPNLLVNPGFEYGKEGWQNASLNSVSDYPNFIHSGTSSANFANQLVQNLEPGKTYRAGVWLKIWSSSGEDRTISENPGDVVARICINVNGDTNPGLPTSICSSAFRPIDTWQYITVDAIPSGDRVVVMTHGFFTGDNKPYHNQAIWDDFEFGLSPIIATPIVPPSRPGPPAPVAFDAVAMRDSMNSARSNLEQMGGLLDRLVRGSHETCDEYSNFYRGLVASPRYDGIPGEWQGLYNEYIFAVENGSLKNQPIFDLCFEHQGGGITELNYGVARAGVNDSLNRLIPAIEATNAMLGQ